MNDETYTPCTKCGRPMRYCKGQCCGKVRKCSCGGCESTACGVIRQCQPECSNTAVIPSVVTEHADSLKNFRNTLVHVSDINTTFYVDDEYHPIITWAGPVDIPGYDMENNPNNYRNQIVTDVAAQEAVIYDKNGKGYVFGLVEDLDLQDQINNKLDEMAEDGTMQQLLNQAFGGYVNVKMAGVVGDGVTDDTQAIQDVIDDNPNKTIYFPDGTYLISSHIETPADNDKSVCLELSDHAVIKASDSYIDPLPMICLGYKDYSSYYLYENFASFGIEGGYLDCNNVTGGIEIDNCIRPYVKNITIDNVKTNGLYLATGANNNSLDATVDNVVIICNNNTEAIGMKITTSDNWIQNVRTFSGKYGLYFESAGGNQVTETHALAVSRDYTTLADAQNMCAYYFKSGGGHYNYLTRCYADGFATAFYFDGQHNNFIRDAYIYYWNEEDTNNHTAFRFTSTLTGRVSNAHIRMPALGTNKCAIVSNRNNPNGWFKDITVHNISNVTDGYDDTIFDALFNIDTRNALSTEKNYVFVGDSYLEGYSPDGDTTSFGERVKTILGLSTDNYKAVYNGGYGFATTNNFTTLVDAQIYNSRVTDVIVLAGYNDRNKTQEEITTGMANFKEAVASKYPFANIKVGFIAKSTSQAEQPYIQNGIDRYIKACGANGITYLTNIDNALYNLSTMMASDGYHPNNTGQEAIATALLTGINGTSCTVTYPRVNITMAPSGSCTSVGSGTYQNAGKDNLVQINGTRNIFTVPVTSYNATGGTTMIELASLSNCYITGTQNNNANMAMVGAVVKHRASSSDPYSFTSVNGYLCFRNGKLYFGMQHQFSDNSSTFANIAEIQVMAFSATFMKD